MCNLCASQAQVKWKLLASSTKVNVLKIFVMDCVFLSFMIFFSHCLEAERFFSPVYVCISFNISAPVVEVTDCSANGDTDCENNAVNTQCIADVCSCK